MVKIFVILMNYTKINFLSQICKQFNAEDLKPQNYLESQKSGQLAQKFEILQYVSKTREVLCNIKLVIAISVLAN